MSKKNKMIIWIVIVIIISILLPFRNKIYNRNITRTKKSASDKINVTIIDKDNKIEELHKYPEQEKYIQVDAIINGKYYHNVGLRTKGYSTYQYLRRNDRDQYSYKIKLNYVHPEQRYERNSRVSFKYTCYGSNKNKRISSL